jgi:hypothetical protein
MPINRARSSFRETITTRGYVSRDDTGLTFYSSFARAYACADIAALSVSLSLSLSLFLCTSPDISRRAIFRSSVPLRRERLTLSASEHPRWPIDSSAERNRFAVVEKRARSARETRDGIGNRPVSHSHDSVSSFAHK